MAAIWDTILNWMHVYTFQSNYFAVRVILFLPEYYISNMEAKYDTYWYFDKI